MYYCVLLLYMLLTFGMVFGCRYLLAALCATCFYSLITAISSVRLLSSSACSAKTLFYLILLDVVSSLCMRKQFQHGICMHGYRTTTALAIVNYPVK